MTDAPSCGYDHIYITVEKVRVHTSATAEDGGGWQEIVLSPARRIDLLDLTNGVLEELGSTPLPAGDYQQIRLVLANNTGNNPLAKLAEQNMAIFKAAAAAFMPGAEKSASPVTPSTQQDELASLREQMAEMQKRLDALSK